MARSSGSQGSRQSERVQDDPGETIDPQRSTGNFDQFAWTQLNQIFERLGKLDQKIDQLATKHEKLSDSVEKHDKLILRAIWTVGGAIAIIAALWFLYDNVLKDHIVLK